MSKPFILGFCFALICLPPLRAQTATNPPADPNGKAANAQPAGQAPDDLTKRISDLVHAGKYPEAQQLTTGLLVAYPDDQRLIKAKVLIEKLLSPAGSTSGAPTSNQPTNTVAPAQAALTTPAESLAGMERVDYTLSSNWRGRRNKLKTCHNRKRCCSSSWIRAVCSCRSIQIRRCYGNFA